LRDKGATALLRHLGGEVGKRRRVLMESERVGRTEPFTPVLFNAPGEPGTIVEAAIAGHDGRRLLAA
jgi:threonylcarbamoyladenosine tRNA methylthiotransferase MtaB